MTFIDTNYFLRLLLQDRKRQFIKVKELFLKASRGQEELISSTVVFFEIYWVLESFYKLEKVVLCENLMNILNLNCYFSEKNILIETVNLFKNKNLNIEDCYNLAFCQDFQIKDMATFDAKLSKQSEKLVGQT